MEFKDDMVYRVKITEPREFPRLIDYLHRTRDIISMPRHFVSFVHKYIDIELTGVSLDMLQGYFPNAEIEIIESWGRKEWRRRCKELKLWIYRER